MTDPAQVALTIGVPTLAVLVGILINNSRLTDLRGYMEARFTAVDRRIDDVYRRIDDMRDILRAELRRVEEIMDARLSRIEQELHLK
jgi:hypothetical protein